MRQLLEKLEVHAPGSGVIRAYCRCLRGNELRGIITTMLEDEDLSEPQVAENIEVDPKQEDESPGEEQVLATPVNNDTASEIPHEEIPAPSSVASRLFGESSSLAHTENNNSSHAMAEESSGEKQANDFSSGDTDLDFLESSETVFDGDKAQDADETMESHSANDDTNSSLDHGSIPESVLLASTTDITMDIQMNEDTTSNQNADENPWTDDTTEATGGVEEAAIVTESEELNTHDAEESVEQFDTEGHDTENVGEVEEEAREGPVEATTAQNEDYDWLANSTELDAETAEADSFEHEMATVSEDEADVAHQEQAEPPQDYNWSTAEATEPTIEEGAETSEEAQNDVDGEAYENEEAYENGVVEDNGDYSVDGEVAAEDTEDTDAQYELGGGVDADDEEAETFGDWEKGFDPNSNHYFWFNHSTGESSWTPPEGWPYEVDEPFSAENEDAAEGAEAGEEQQDQEYDEQGTEAQEYEEGGVEEQEYAEGAAEGEYYEEEAGGEQYNEANAEGQCYEESAEEGQYYEVGTYDEGEAEGQYYEEGAEQHESQEYEEGAADDQYYEEGAVEEQQYEENTTDGQWYDETAAEGQDYATEDQNYEVAADEGHTVEQTEEESPRRSEVSDFEFDDSDLPGF